MGVYLHLPIKSIRFIINLKPKLLIMKNIFICSVCLGILILAGCRSNNKGKKENVDSLNIAGKTDTAFDQMRSFFKKGFTNFDPDATLNNIDIYPDLKRTTDYVKFDYKAFKFFIDSLDKEFKVTAKVIYLVYGAYTANDVTRYLETHVTVPPIKKDDINDQPTLLVGYKHPTKDFLIYNDIATICPPPNSCSTMFIFPEKKQTFIGNVQSGFDPDLMIKKYNTTYNHPNPLYHPLTESVKFDIEAIKYLVDSLDSANKNGTSEIYFAMGAYTEADAVRYTKTHPGTKTEEIVDRTCVLFAYKTPGVEGFKHFDIGTICPPATSCLSGFKYGN